MATWRPKSGPKIGEFTSPEPPAAWEQILDLATADGWTAVYDPTNPDTRTLRVDGADSYFESIADGLGNLPDLTQAT
ncbi:MAG: hypothetical protein Q8P46_07050, partial [Hyphomicrobiales bacterium]|nr:hypothetical protein [Hyphomicrobiales bacterium]